MNPRFVNRPKYKCLWQAYPPNNELLNNVVSPIVGELKTGSQHVKMHLAEDTTAKDAPKNKTKIRKTDISRLINNQHQDRWT